MGDILFIILILVFIWVFLKPVYGAIGWFFAKLLGIKIEENQKEKGEKEKNE